MKTPREILLKRHRSVEPRLDRMWAENLSPELRSEGAPTRANVFLAVGWTLWRELIWPSRRIWAGLACAWVLIAVLNVASFEPAPQVASKARPPSGEELRALVEQQRMLAQLIGPLSEPVYNQKRTSPGPRSERAAQGPAA
jgi:hypothetical protein